MYPGLAARGPVDLETLRTYCQLWARWREAEDGIATAGQLTKLANGRIVASPLLNVAKDAGVQVQTLERRLGIGLAPADAPPPPPEAARPEPLLTRRQLAEAMTPPVHMQTVTKWEQDGMPIAERGSRGRPSLYRESDVRMWLEGRASAANRSGLIDVAQERARKERAQAVLAEQTFQARSRQLLPAAEVEKMWNTEIQAVRAAILATWTTQADRLHRAAVLDGVSGVEAVLKDLAITLLRELADPERPMAETASPAPDDDEPSDEGHAAHEDAAP